MVEFQFRSNNREKVAALSYTISDAFVGWQEFINNNVVVTPEEYDKSEKVWVSSVIVGPNNPGHDVLIKMGDNMPDMEIITQNQSIVEMYNDASVKIQCSLAGDKEE